MKKSNKPSACHNCRTAHKKCVGGSPCNRCASRGVPCYPYQAATTTSTTTIHKNKRQHADLSQSSHAQRHSAVEKCLESTQKQLDEVVTRYTQLQEQQIMLYCELNHCRSKNEISLNMWSAPFNSQLPTYVYDGNMRIIGANEAFRNLYKMSVQELDGRDLTDLNPQRLKDAWTVLVNWIHRTPLKHVASTFITQTADGTEIVVRADSRIHRNFTVTTMVPVDHYCDEFVLDDLVTEETFRVQHNQNQVICKMLMTPKHSFQRLVDVLLKIKPNYVYRDEEILQAKSVLKIASLAHLDLTTRQQQSPPQQLQPLEQQCKDMSPVKFAPVELSFQELEFVASKLNHNHWHM